MKKACLPAIARKSTISFTILIAAVLMLCLCNATAYAQKAAPASPPVLEKAQPQFTYTIIEGANGTFGYDVYVDGRLKLHQPSIPAMPGNKGFKTKAAAAQVAQLAIRKMKEGESLPAISPEELTKLKVI
ncbi:MAG: DUF4907 domain-containing protein [Williamsia sp.]|nr:DUF4907 domain-containing protein [Williamsia sp.]